MNHKVGDKVIINSLEWFKANCNLSNNGDYFHNTDRNLYLAKYKIPFCGEILTIETMISNYGYYMEETGSYWWFDWMFDDSRKNVIEILRGNYIEL